MGPKERPYQIAYLDLENGPSLGYVWEKWETDVLHFEREWSLLSFAVKWAGERRIECLALPDFPAYRRKPHDDSALVAKLWQVFDRADLIVAHNGDRFDVRKANARFALNGLRPPSPYKTVDTLKIARKHFMFTSNKLNDLADVFGLGRKVQTGGFELWLKCMNGDSEAWAKMKKYNIHDVALLEKLYEKLRPWHTTHPNITVASGKSLLCPVCASPTKRAGWYNLKTWRAQRFQCLGRDCMKYSYGKREKLPQEVLC